MVVLGLAMRENLKFLPIGLAFCLLSMGISVPDVLAEDLHQEKEATQLDQKNPSLSGDEARRRFNTPQFNPSLHVRIPNRSINKYWAAEVYSDILSRYVWKGLLFSRGAVWQPSFSVEVLGLGLNVWANMPMTGGINEGQFDEIDLSLYYHHMFKNFYLRAWILGLLYPNENPLSLDDGSPGMQILLHISYHAGPVILFSDFSISIFNDPGALYWDVGLGHKRSLPLNFSMEFSGLISLANGTFNQAHIAPVGTKLNLFEFSLAFPWEPIIGFTVAPKMYVSTLLASSLRNAVGQPDVIWGGLSLSYAFGPHPKHGDGGSENKLRPVPTKRLSYR